MTILCWCGLFDLRGNAIFEIYVSFLFYFADSFKVCLSSELKYLNKEKFIQTLFYLHSLSGAGKLEHMERHTGFDITVASEIMAVLALTTGLRDMREKLGE